ncbi:UNVERIFIED_CONTAM: hypothetical protein ABID98_000177 [Brevibacillus sp. OAP136]
MKQDKGLYVIYFVGMLVVFYIAFNLLGFQTRDIGLTFAVLMLVSHFIANTLSSPYGVWSNNSQKQAAKKVDFEE